MLGNRGFTLIELMVTVAVIAILSAMAAPAMSDLIAQQRLNKSVRELTSTLSVARSQAALLHREVTVTLNSTDSDTPFNYHWQPTINNRITSSTTSVVFNMDGTVKSATTDIDFVICSSKTLTSKTISLTKIGTYYAKAEGVCT